MNDDFIPLPSVIPGREYRINYIRKGKSCPDDLRGYGIFRGSTIKLLFSSPSRNPSAYEVMGAVLALRQEDAAGIYVSPAAIRPIL